MNAEEKKLEDGGFRGVASEAQKFACGEARPQGPHPLGEGCGGGR